VIGHRKRAVDQRRPIRYQLAAIVLVPLTALAVLAALRTYSALGRAGAARAIQRDSTLATSVNTLAHQLQRERGLSAGFAGSGYRGDYGPVRSQRVQSDEALRAFDRLANPPGRRGAVRTALAAAGTALRGLPQQRDAIDSHALTVEATLSYYTDTIAALLGVDRAIADTTGDARGARIATALLDFSEAKESTALERGYLNSVFSAGAFAPGGQARLVSIIASRDAWLGEFRGVADPAASQYFDQHVRGPAVTRAAALTAVALTQEAERGGQLDVRPAEWWSVMTTQIDLMRDVELRLAGQLRSHAAGHAASARDDAGLSIAIGMIVVIMSFVLSMRTARRMERSLRGLRDAAIEAADVRLPRVVAQLTQGVDVAFQAESRPVWVESNDEIGDTASAFNHIHDTALRLTVEQAGMRRNLGDTLLNLARRSQALIHQQLELIDGMEHGESDGDKLKSLFRLDHLATRMRRHTEDIIVLSGAVPSRGWTAPMPFLDVVRGAVAEVEHYTRVEVRSIPDVAVVGHVVGDLLHLLAELIENATKFSPPTTTVQVTAGEVGKGYIIEIEDRGIGMNLADLARHNDRLANPPAFDLSTSDRLGLFVVGRLAARHEIRVNLRQSVFGGLTALVLIDSGLLERAEPGDGHAALGAVHGRSALSELPGSGGSAIPAPRPDADAAPSTATEPAASTGSDTGIDTDTGRATAGPAAPAPAPSPAPAPPLPRRRPAPPTVLPPDQSPAGPRTPATPPPPAIRPPVTTTVGAVRAASAAPGPHPNGAGASAGAGFTPRGLPRRVPRRNMVAGLRKDEASSPAGGLGNADQTAGTGLTADAGSVTGTGSVTGAGSAAGATPVPSPEEFRTLLHGYQAGFDRGRLEGLDLPLRGDEATGPLLAPHHPTRGPRTAS